MNAEVEDILKRIESKANDIRSTNVKNIATNDAVELFRLATNLGFAVARDRTLT